MTKFNLLNLFFWLIILIPLLIISINVSYHPILIIIMIIIYRTLICLNISSWKNNFIYSIFLFLIIIRGLLIIFLYFSSLISNEQINFSWNKIILLSFIINLIYFFINIPLNKLTTNNLIYFSKEINSIKNINDKIFINILNLYNYPFNNITLIRIIYLLITLFTIIKILTLKVKPLRKINN